MAPRTVHADVAPSGQGDCWKPCRAEDDRGTNLTIAWPATRLIMTYCGVAERLHRSAGAVSRVGAVTSGQPCPDVSVETCRYVASGASNTQSGPKRTKPWIAPRPPPTLRTMSYAIWGAAGEDSGRERGRLRRVPAALPRRGR